MHLCSGLQVHGREERWRTMAQSETVPATSHHTDTWMAGASGELRAPQAWEAELCLDSFLCLKSVGVRILSLL